MKLKQSIYLNTLTAGSERLGLRIAGAASAAGLLQAMVVAIINGALANLGQGDLNIEFFGMFALCIVGYIYLNRWAVSQAVALIGRVIYGIHVKVADNLRRADLQSFEEINKARILKVLMENTDVVIESTRAVANASSGLVMIVISSLYIASLSLEAFVLAALMVGLGYWAFHATYGQVGGKLRRSKARETDYLGYLNHLLDGFKEVKMSRPRGEDLFQNYISVMSQEARRLRVDTEMLFTTIQVFGQAFFFVMVAGAVFVLPQITDLADQKIVSITSVFLFMIGPLSQVVLTIPLFSKAELAMEQIQQMERELAERDDSAQTRDEGPLAWDHGVRAITLEGLRFTFGQVGGQRPFTLGPIDLTIKGGELLFVVGGNGAGKSTLMKLIAGLYYPQEGRLLFNGTPVTPENYALYRERLSIVLSDFHLFDRFYGQPQVDAAQVDRLLAEFDLAELVAYQDGRFSNLNLSSGQKKRLALIASYVEDHQVFLFDEVAADLDPQFRVYFYSEYLPRLRDTGKTIVAISHDDRFFHLADRVVKMEYGLISSVQSRH